MSADLSITLTALSGDDAAEHVSRFLALVFEDQTPTAILPRLAALPLLITDQATSETAEIITRHLKARGASVAVSPGDDHGDAPAFEPLKAGSPARAKVHSQTLKQHRSGGGAPTAVVEPPPWEQAETPPKAKKKGLFGGVLGR